MKIWKLVAGILSIIFSVIVFFQSMLVGTANTLSSNAGLFVSIFMLSGGIVSIVIRNSEKTTGNIALGILFGLGAFLGFSMAGSYSDLNIWAGWCFINMGLAIVSVVKLRKRGY